MGIEKPAAKQEADPLVGFDAVATEFITTAKKGEGLLASMGGVDALPPEDQAKFLALEEEILAKLYATAI